MLHDSVTFRPRIGGLVTPHVGWSETTTTLTEFLNVVLDDWFICGHQRDLIYYCYANVRHATKSSNFIARATLLLNKVAYATVNFPSANDRQTNMASSDTADGIIIISSALLIALTLSNRHTVTKITKLTCNVNKQLTNHSSATERETAEE